jgi:two-component system nitrogen regulation response regulator NtrX
MSETVLIVDDEDGVRRTFHEWLTGSGLDVQVFAAADSQAALLIANDHPIDLAILDWNLGSGMDGLRLLEDLVVFQPEIVAILVTGFANQATPLDALRMGVRDYFDKNQDLTRERFLTAVSKQLERIRPAKREREVNRSLHQFRDSVEKILPLVRSAAALNDPVPLPEAIHSLFRFVLQSTEAPDGVLIAVHQFEDGRESIRTYDSAGALRDTPTVPFRQSLAATVVSLQEPCVMNDFDPSTTSSVELMPFEQGRRSVLAVPLRVGTGTHVVLELFDKPAFTEADRRVAAVAAEIGGELLRQALAERHTQQLLFDAVEAALRASHQLVQKLGDSSRHETSPTPTEIPPPRATDELLERLRQGLDENPNAIVAADTSLKLIEAIRALALRHGPEAVNHCITLVASLQTLLDRLTTPE